MPKIDGSTILGYKDGDRVFCKPCGQKLDLHKDIRNVLTEFTVKKLESLGEDEYYCDECGEWFTSNR